MSSLFKNRQIIKLVKVDSTNTYLSEIQKSLPEGSVVWAQDQTKGRGQNQNKWASEPGKNLTFSIILYPQFLPVYQQFYMSKVLALAVSDFISLHTDNVSIKWPNDIYVHNSKICGILIENVIEKVNIKQTIAGIGINLNQTKFPSNLPNPTSLAQITGQPFNVEDTLSEILELIDYRYLLLKNKDFSTIDKNFNDCLFRFHKLSTFMEDGKTFEGTITGVEATGELIIKDTSGKIRKFMHKEVEFVL
jgi:BirA family transcriptional regulator, biotin operon repressor / biotin---[acetyl-CoA-carboxylase] ligase